MAVVTEAFDFNNAFEAQSQSNVRQINLSSGVELTNYSALSSLSDEDRFLQSELKVVSEVLWDGAAPLHDEAAAAVDVLKAVRTKLEPTNGGITARELEDLSQRLESDRTRYLTEKAESLGSLVAAQGLGLWVRLSEKVGDIPEADPSGLLLSRLAKLVGFAIQKDEQDNSALVTVVVGTNGVKGLLTQRSELYVQRRG